MNLTDTIFIPRGEGRGFVVRIGQLLRVKQPKGGKQVGDFNAWNLHDPRERFWGSRTALYHGMHVQKGDQLHSTWPGERPMFTILEDTINRRKSARGALQHDVVLGRCSQKYRVKRYRLETVGCQENLASGIAQFNLGPEHVHDALNLFMYTGLDENDRFFFEVSDAEEGDYVDLRAEIDCIVSISSCPGACTGPDAKGLICEIFEG
jgi:uncharacterized protein